jgi:AraC family transcriptional regulator
VIEPIKIVEIEPIKVYSVSHVGDYNKIGITFEKLMKWAYTNKIKNKKNLMGKDAFSYGIAYDDPNVTDVDKLRSDACITNSDESVKLEGEIFKQEISGGKYAIFLHVGEYSKLKETYNDIFSNYVKRDDINLRDVPIFEKYLNRDPRRTKPENLKTQIYIPIS